MGASKHRCPNPKCRQNLLIPRKMRGKEVRCVECGEQFVAPVRFDLSETLDRANSGLLSDIC